jgi:beta-glucosidase
VLVAGCPAPVRLGEGTGSGTGTGGTFNGFGGVLGTAGQGGSGANEVVLGPEVDGGTVDGGSGTGGAPVKMACAAATIDPLPYTSGYTADPANRTNAMSLAMQMSSTEQTQQMSGLPQSGSANYNVFNQEDNKTRGIRGWYFRDGPRGVNLNATHDGKKDYATAFPVAIARAAAFDLGMEYKVGQAIGDEMLASGNTMMLAPTVNTLRHPAWGRSQETYGEDSFMLGRLGSAFVMGLQNYIAACVKHYAANNIEDGRGTANAVIDDETLREKYGRHFEMITDEGGAAAVMASYNLVNGTHSTQNSVLLTDMLRTEFGFQGFVLTDWWAMNGSSAPKCCAPGTGADPLAKAAVNAGLDMELPWRFNYLELPSLVSSGGLQSSQLATGTARILEQKYRFHADQTSGYGLQPSFTTLDNGSGSIQKNEQLDPAIGGSHIQVAEAAAEEGMVLLKNDNSTLPISRSAVTKIAVIGATVQFALQQTGSQDCSGNGSSGCSIDFTTNVRTGDAGSSRVFSDPAKSIGPLAGITGAAGSGITVTRYSKASDAISAGFDFAVVMAGLTSADEGEEYTGAGDRTTGGITATTHQVVLSLDPKVGSGTQNQLISDVAAAGKPMVVVLEAGGIVDMSSWYSKVPAVVMAWYPGMLGGAALGRLLFGDANFSGKLPVTWDTNLAHWPEFASSSGPNTTMDYWVGYQHFDHDGTTLSPKDGSFPFGYGLSYTTFSYENLQVPCTTVPANGVVPVQVEVHNQSAVAGAETVFVFVQFPSSSVPNRSAASYKELKGFYRVSLAAKGSYGDAKRITIPIRVKDLKYWNAGAPGWSVEPGMVKVIVSPNAGAVSTPCAGSGGVGCSLSDSFMVTGS